MEALCYVDGNCTSAYEIMARFAANTYEGPFGQAHEAPQLSEAPYTPFNDERSFKPVAGSTRYVAIEGGSFFDAIVRGFFGYHAPLQWGSDPVGLNKTLASSAPRGFEGMLRNLRTPFGLAYITSKLDGVEIKLH